MVKFHNLFKALGVLFTAASLSACGTVMSENDCASADWRVLGEQDGDQGLSFEQFGKRAEACAKFGLNADQAAYDAGRSAGLSRYCTPEGGFYAGRNGEKYRGVCLPQDEEIFLSEFELGLELYKRETAYAKAIKNYEDAVQSLEQHRKDIRSARNRSRDDNLSNEDRETARRDVEYHGREIDALEYDLPLLEADIDRAGSDLDDYKSFLTREGKIL